MERLSPKHPNLQQEKQEIQLYRNYNKPKNRIFIEGSAEIESQSSYVAKYEEKAKERGGDGGHQPTASEEYETFVSETTWMMLLLR